MNMTRKSLSGCQNKNILFQLCPTTGSQAAKTLTMKLFFFVGSRVIMWSINAELPSFGGWVNILWPFAHNLVMPQPRKPTMKMKWDINVGLLEAFLLFAVWYPRKKVIRKEEHWESFIWFLSSSTRLNSSLGKPSWKKGKKGDIVPFWRPLPLNR